MFKLARKRRPEEESFDVYVSVDDELMIVEEERITI
jgi:hypothetical protein